MDLYCYSSSTVGNLQSSHHMFYIIFITERKKICEFNSRQPTNVRYKKPKFGATDEVREMFEGCFSKHRMSDFSDRRRATEGERTEFILSQGGKILNRIQESSIKMEN